jgi:hypothetical protein
LGRNQQPTLLFAGVWQFEERADITDLGRSHRTADAGSRSRPPAASPLKRTRRVRRNAGGWSAGEGRRRREAACGGAGESGGAPVLFRRRFWFRGARWTDHGRQGSLAQSPGRVR